MKGRIRIIISIIIVSLIFSHCKRERKNPFDPKNPSVDVIYSPQTKIPSQNPDVIKDTLIGDKVYITYKNTPPEFKEGDILIGLRGEGYLRKVKSYSVQGNQVILETEQATMREAFTKLVIDTCRRPGVCYHPIE